MDSISQQRCFNHRQREAVALCPECKRFFCRECVTEHEGRVLCASCLKRIAAGIEKRPFKTMLLTLQCISASLVLWLIFYYMGQILLLVPHSFHEGTLWKELPWQ